MHANANPHEEYMIEANRAWWKEAVVYQIYPRSFMDSNGDGIGDIPGITSKLDYLEELGIDVLWLSPIYQSPNDDNGYDISDYHAIMPELGTMEDFDRLLAGVHERGMRLIMDLVVNHTSDEHSWFIESRSSKGNPRRDWYIWHPGKNGGPPNNWASCFGGPAWEYDKPTGEYYLHLFSRKQPDLNWLNPEVRQAVYAMMRWWLDKGIDGWRMDVINWMIKPEGLVDAPVPPGKENERHIFDAAHLLNNRGMHEVLREMNRDVLSRYDILTVGEAHELTPQTGIDYIDEARRELQTVFQFDILYTEDDLVKRKQRVREWYEVARNRAWNTITLSNHDTPRMVSRFGDDRRFRMESAKCLAAFLMTAPGTPYLLQGEEIGMTNVAFESIEDYNDIHMRTAYRVRIEAGEDPSATFAELRPKSRDNARTPMQWDASPHAGFTPEEPWLKVNPNYGEINVENQCDNPDSVYHFYRKLIRLRKANPALVYGDYRVYLETDPVLHMFTRSEKDRSFLIVLNHASAACARTTPTELMAKKWRLCLANYKRTHETLDDSLKLQPWEARIYESC
jgi:oligo-1,6-glucosidase